jgi:hypothetical protein
MRIVTKAVVSACLAVLLVWASPLHAKVIDLSGTWKFNFEKSDGGGLPIAKAATVKAVHKEPALKYWVTGTNGEGKPFNSEFDGAIDGKPYKETDGEATTLKRINDSTLEGTTTSPDGKTTSTFTTTVSKDGKVLTRKVTVKTPEREYKVLEVYEKQ